MSKFYDALERAANRVVEPVAHPPLQANRQEELAWAISKMDAEASSSAAIPSPKVEPGRPILAEEILDTSDDLEGVEQEIEQQPEPKPSILSVVDHSIHPAYERIIQKLVSHRRSPSQGVILFAGAVSGEGASTIARNTALALGRVQGEQVVLVDGNVRTPSQHEAFHSELSGGLCDVLRGAIPLTAAVRPEVAPGLSLLAAGRIEEPPPQLLTMSAMQGISMALTSLFDWVIIDGSPVTTFPESASLAAVSGGALLVVRAGRTRQEVVEEAKRVLEESGTDVLGAVLNRRRYYIPELIYRRL